MSDFLLQNYLQKIGSPLFCSQFITFVGLSHQLKNKTKTENFNNDDFFHLKMDTTTTNNYRWF